MINLETPGKLGRLWAKGAVMLQLLRSAEFVLISVGERHLSHPDAAHVVSTNANALHVAKACADFAGKLAKMKIGKDDANS